VEEYASDAPKNEKAKKGKNFFKIGAQQAIEVSLYITPDLR